MAKKKKEIDTRKLEIILDIILILVGFVFLYFGIRDLKVKIDSTKITDGERFAKTYSYVSKDESVYKYVSYVEAANIVTNADATILVGEPLDPWTQVLVKPLNDIYKKKKQNIYYLEFSDKDKETHSYNVFTKSIKKKNLSTPMIIISKKGKQKIYTKSDIYDKSYDGAPIDYFTKENLDKLKKLID